MLTPGHIEPSDIWVVTDLDGTLLDHAYDWSAAKPALRWLKQIGVAVIPCTSKTAEEVRRFRQDADLDGPFIVENGGAIHGGAGQSAWERGLGQPHQALKTQLRALETRVGTPLRALEDLSPDEVTALTGLKGEAAAMAQRRSWSVPFLNTPEAIRDRLEEEAEALDLTVVQGNRMSHLLQAGTSKGQALEALKDHFDQKDVHVLALGDSPNDLPLLNAGDHSVVVPGAQGAHPKLRASVASGDFALAPAAHAVGWACSVLSHVRTLVPPALAATAPEPPHDWP